MRRSQHTRNLHVALQIPKLAQAHPAHINNIRAQRDGRARMLAIRHLRAQRLHKTREVLVQRKEARHLGILLFAAGVLRHLAVRLVDGLFVGVDGLAVEVADLKQVQRDAATVAAAGPLRVEAAALLVGGDVDGVVEQVDLRGCAPVLGVAELLGRVGDDPAAGAEVAEEDGVVVGGRRARLVELFVGEVRFEGVESSFFLGG